MKLHYCLAFAVLGTACHKSKYTPEPQIHPVVVPVAYTDTFTGSYTCHHAENNDNPVYEFDTTFAIPFIVYVHHYVDRDSLCIYDSLRYRFYSFNVPSVYSGYGWYSGLYSVHVQASDSNKYHVGDFYIRIAGDSLFYSNEKAQIGYKGGMISSITIETFQGKKL